MMRGNQNMQRQPDERIEERACAAPLVFSADCAQYDTLAIDGQTGSAGVQLSDIPARGGGCMLEIRVRIRQVAPGREVALGVMLYEADEAGGERIYGVRTVLLPAHPEERACDVQVRGIWFVLGETTGGGQRRLRARADAHYTGGQRAESCALRG